MSPHINSLFLGITANSALDFTWLRVTFGSAEYHNNKYR